MCLLFFRFLFIYLPVIFFVGLGNYVWLLFWLSLRCCYFNGVNLCLHIYIFLISTELMKSFTFKLISGYTILNIIKIQSKKTI